MGDDDMTFDSSQKKKKKTKKVDFNMEEAAAQPEAGADSPQQEVTNLADDLADLDFLQTKKKKKSKKIPKDQSEEQTEGNDEEGENGSAAAKEPDDDLNLDFSQTKKKKKSKRVVVTGEDAAEGGEDDGDDDQDDSESSPSTATAGGATPWANSERDYTYEELLNHVFNIIKEKNPDIIAGEKRRLVMRPPQVLRVGTKKSSFANFLEICKSLHRQPKHMQAFLLAELGTSGSVDANNQLIIKGRFQQKQIESVLRRYIKEYVACQTCRSPETILQKDTRLFFLNCETCGSRRSVASIKSGFQAVTGKRAAMRAKTA